MEPEAKSLFEPKPRLHSPKNGPFRLCRINREARIEDYHPEFN